MWGKSGAKFPAVAPLHGQVGCYRCREWVENTMIGQWPYSKRVPTGCFRTLAQVGISLTISGFMCTRLWQMVVAWRCSGTMHMKHFCVGIAERLKDLWEGRIRTTRLETWVVG